MSSVRLSSGVPRSLEPSGAQGITLTGDLVEGPRDEVEKVVNWYTRYFGNFRDEWIKENWTDRD